MQQNLAKLIPRYSAKKIIIDESELDIKGKLGIGASGVTYKATFRGEDVAVKIYDKSILTKDFQCCQNEMDFMTSIQHQNIIAFRGLILTDSPPKAGLVTLLAPNGELGDAIHKNKIIKRGGTKLKYSIAIGMARALAYLHDHGIVHRDIKPANILLGNECQALITDFGLSRYIDSSGEMTGETGSYRYMSPEVIRHGKYSGKADVYSFAVVVNELFSGEHPYEFYRPVDAARCVVKDGLRPSQKRIKQKRLKALITCCWDADPCRRPDWQYIIQELQLSNTEYINQKNSSGVKGIVKRLSV